MCHAIHHFRTPFFRTELVMQRPGHQHRPCHRVNRQGYGPRHFQIFPGHIQERSGILLTLRFFLFRLRLSFLRLNILPRCRSRRGPRGRFAVDPCVARAGEDVTFNLRREKPVRQLLTFPTDSVIPALIRHKYRCCYTDR